MEPEYYIIKNKGKVKVTSHLQSGLWEWGVLRDNKEQATGDNRFGPSIMPTHNMCLCDDCMERLTVRCPDSFRSLWAQREPLPLEASRTAAQLQLPGRRRAQLLPRGFDRNDVFHGLIEHMVSGQTAWLIMCL